MSSDCYYVSVCYAWCMLFLGFVMSSVCYVKGSLCPAFVCLGFVMSRVCLSKVCHNTLHIARNQLFYIDIDGYEELTRALHMIQKIIL